MLEKLEKYKKTYTLIVFFVGLIVGGIWSVFSTYQGFIDKYEELTNTIKTTQQMALKSVIWNEEIPIVERASACDVYLNAGYNSLTKKECETILEKGANTGIFSYIEKGSEKNGYNNNNDTSYYNRNLYLWMYSKKAS